MSLLLPISVSYDCDPDRVEEILVEEAKAGAKEIPGFLSDPEPFVRFIPGFGEFSLNFTLICQVAEFVDQYLVQHEMRKRIFKRFKREGIEIPFPIRTVYMKTVRPQKTEKRLNRQRNLHNRSPQVEITRKTRGAKHAVAFAQTGCDQGTSAIVP
jgi:small-conductance mechanosensitive channel